MRALLAQAVDVVGLVQDDDCVLEVNGVILREGPVQQVVEGHHGHLRLISKGLTIEVGTHHLFLALLPELSQPQWRQALLYSELPVHAQLLLTHLSAPPLQLPALEMGQVAIDAEQLSRAQDVQPALIHCFPQLAHHLLNLRVGPSKVEDLLAPRMVHHAGQRPHEQTEGLA